MIFLDRHDAGKKLAAALRGHIEEQNTLVIGLPRGGVIVAFEVANALKLPLDIICPRKIGAPFNEEFAIGAVTHTGEGFFNEDAIRSLQIPRKYIAEEIEKKKQESRHYYRLFKKEAPLPDVKGKCVLLVDDGIATGATMKAAISWAQKNGAKKIQVAVPTAPFETIQELDSLVDEVICLTSPLPFYAVGQVYSHFDQTSNDEVIACLS